MFGFASVGHFFASVAKNAVKFAKSAGPVLTKIDAKIEANKPLIEEITKLVSPKAAQIEDASFALFGKVAHAIQSGSDATSANGLSISLDKAFIDEFKALLPAVEEFAANHGIAKPVVPTV